MEAIKNDPRLQGDCDKVAVIKLVIDEQVTSFRRENCLEMDDWCLFFLWGFWTALGLSYFFWICVRVQMLSY